MQSLCFLFLLYGDHRDLHVLTHSFPTRRSSDLDLPQPEVPTRETISCWPTDRVTPASARWERLAPAMEPTSPNTLPTSVISSTARLLGLAEAVLPGQRAPRGGHQQRVGRLAGQREENQRTDADGRASGHLPGDHEEAEALAGAHQLGGGDEHPRS